MKTLIMLPIIMQVMDFTILKPLLLALMVRSIAGGMNTNPANGTKLPTDKALAVRAVIETSALLLIRRK